MNAERAIPILFSLGLGLVATIAAAGELPVSFGRSGGVVSVRLAGGHDRSKSSVVLEAFGQSWAGPVDAKDGRVDFDVPSVRVPTVFRMVTVESPRHVLGELVAYPPGHKLKWDRPSAQAENSERIYRHREPIVIFIKDAPAWFTEWARAVGLPVNTGTVGLTNVFGSEQHGRHLMVVGRKAAGKDATGSSSIMRDPMNVLVLEADWFGKPGPSKISVVPESMAGPLAHFANQHWSAPLDFTRVHAPCPNVVNRWAWIEVDSTPLAERLWAHNVNVVSSYVPWQQRLGRKALADLLFQDLLYAAALVPRTPPALKRNIELLWPSKETVQRRTRPVLYASMESGDVLSGSYKPHGFVEGKDALLDLRFMTSLRVIDLRGPNLPDHAVARIRIPKDASERHPLLVLGTDPAVDDGRWAEPLNPLDGKQSAKKNVGKEKSGVVWLPNDQLPPSTEAQVRLMQTLTRFGVLLKGSANTGKRAATATRRKLSDL